MIELTCLEIEELLAAYAVDALEAAEVAEVEHHMVECRVHDGDLAAYRSVTELLPTMLPLAAPSQRLRVSLLDAFDDAVAGRSATRPQAPAKRLWLLRTPGFAYGLAAALLVIGLGLGAWGASRGGEGEPAIVVRSVQSAGMSLEFVYVPERSLAVFDPDLPALASDRAYQAWQITGAGPVSLGLIHATGVTAFQVDLSNASAIAISVEPAGGSPQPTTTPILVSEL